MGKRKAEIYSKADQRKAMGRLKDTPRRYDELPVDPVLLDFAKGRTYFIRTYGCQANIRDEEIFSGYLEKAGFSKANEAENADLVILNTCAVRENAEEKIYGEIGKFKASFEKDKSFILVIAGCVMGENGIAEALMKSYPHISLCIGTHEVSKILPLLTEVVKKKKPILNVTSFAGEVVEGMPSVRLNEFEAFVNISYGCDKFCTYCIVPYTRGRERSRRMEDIIKECKDLEVKGYKQVTLLGQNVNSYGLDLKDGTTFAKLLDEVAKLDIPRIKFLTSYPSQFTDDVIEVMASHKNIVPWLHLPVQSGSSAVLKKMARRYTREQYLEVVRKIKARIPDIALSTDIIVGFPYETEEDFLDTLSLCEEVQYASAFTFIYSPRPNTPAASYEQIPDEIKHERFNRLKEVIEKSTSDHSLSMVGKEFEVLVEGPSKRNEEILSGYALNGKLINFKGPAYLKGCLVKVKVNESKTYSLVGELIGDPLLYKAEDFAFHLKRDPLIKEFLAIQEEISSSDEIKKLSDDLVAIKKKMALDMGDKEKHQADKKEYEALLEKIKNHPLLSNRDSLLPLVESCLQEIERELK